MALAYAEINVEIREVMLRDKPASMLAISPKGTVPVLVLSDGAVVDESLDIMLWSLNQSDQDGWLDPDGSERSETQALIDTNDGEFKNALDRYKYSTRFPQCPPEHYRTQAATFLRNLDLRLGDSRYLLGNRISLADIAVFPFIRQFSKIDLSWFQSTPYDALKTWLCEFEESQLFLDVMKKYQPWVEGEPGVPFGYAVSN